MRAYPIVEKFISINGEGQKAGMLAAFIRVKGCNLSCNYCDTAWANADACPYESLSAEELLAWLDASNVNCVTLTGGEPLLIPEIDALIALLTKKGYAVEIETNGSVNIEPFTHICPRPSFTLDYKCPGSDMEDYMDLRSFSFLEPSDTVKFVVSNTEDLDKAYGITKAYHLARKCSVYLSAVFGRIEPCDIVDYMIGHQWNNVHLQLQMHKFIWDPNKKGV